MACARRRLKKKIFVTSRERLFSDLFCERFLFQLKMYFVIYIYIGNFIYILGISDLFCYRFVFQLRVHFVVYILETFDIYRKFTI